MRKIHKHKKRIREARRVTLYNICELFFGRRKNHTSLFFVSFRNKNILLKSASSIYLCRFSSPMHASSCRTEIAKTRANLSVTSGTEVTIPLILMKSICWQPVSQQTRWYHSATRQRVSISRFLLFPPSWLYLRYNIRRGGGGSIELPPMSKLSEEKQTVSVSFERNALLWHRPPEHATIDESK